MIGAREYAKLFKTGQYGKLYITSGSHARGNTFRISILPEGEKAISNGEGNNCLNNDAVEVYGVISGHPGWTESYGWIHKGKWQEDFTRLLEIARAKERDNEEKATLAKIKYSQEEKERQDKLLNSY